MEGQQFRSLRSQSYIPAEVLTFLDNPDEKPFLFPDTHMGPDLLCFAQDEETKELILLAVQLKVSSIVKARTWKTAIISVTPQFFYTEVVCINPCNFRRARPLL